MTNDQNKAQVIRAERERGEALRDQEERAWSAVIAIREAINACSNAQHAIAFTDYAGDDAKYPIEYCDFAAKDLGHALESLIARIAARRFSTETTPESF